MRFETKYLDSESLPTVETECLVVFVASDFKLTGLAAAIDTATGGCVQKRIAASDLGVKQGDHCLLFDPPNISARRLLIINSVEERLSHKAYFELSASIAKLCCRIRIRQVCIGLEYFSVNNRNSTWLAQTLTEAFIQYNYVFSDFKNTSEALSLLQDVIVFSDEQSRLKECQRGIEIGQAVANAKCFARHLGDMPPNVCHPRYLSECAKDLGRGSDKVNVKVLGEQAMSELGMYSLLSVGRGSSQPSQLIILEYLADPSSNQTYAVVGKGVTFDSGGLSIKPSKAMELMKYDMCGAASVLGAFKAIVDLDLPINLVAVVAAAENMINGESSRPGDIVTSMSGKTIEIINTDGEGRLVLCDALTYVQSEYDIAAVIDVATLTGSCTKALGKHASGLFSNDEGLSQSLIQAGEVSGERVWPLPIWEEYGKQIKGKFADLANDGGHPGASVAACFLAEFTQDVAWAHLDVAGTASDESGATANPVGLLVEYLRNQSSGKKIEL